MPVEIRLSRRFLKSLRTLDESDHARVEEALRKLQVSWGTLHAHSGLSIRRLTEPYFDCRAGLELRIVFRAAAHGLDVVMASTHDEVQRLLRNG